MYLKVYVLIAENRTRNALMEKQIRMAEPEE